MTGQRLIASIELRAALIAGRIYTEWATGTVADRLEAAAQYDGGYHDGYGVLSAEDRAGLLSLLLELESAGLSDATSRPPAPKGARVHLHIRRRLACN